jgi:hypothetical protein
MKTQEYFRPSPFYEDMATWTRRAMAMATPKIIAILMIGHARLRNFTSETV